MTEEALVEFREAHHMPSDVPEELLEDFKDILNRIPAGWGRWISCSKGWFPLIAETNRKLRAIDPDYEIHQVKSKLSSLRYYFSPAPIPQPACCDVFDAENLAPRKSWRSDDPRAAEYKEESDAWIEKITAHHESEEHNLLWDALEPLRELQEKQYELMQPIADEAERLSSSICEPCGEPGTLRNRNGWLWTLCENCADDSVLWSFD